MIQKNAEEEILRLLLKDFTGTHTLTEMSEETGMTRSGVWKILKKLEKESLVKLEPIGKGKTSAHKISLNFDNPLLEKTLSLFLAKEASKQDKWRYNLKELADYSDFVVLFGSILHSPKEANDIDILNLISNEKNFSKIDKIILRIQATLDKKIHAINLTEEELKNELKKKNNAYLEALRKGVVLFGQEKFVNFVFNVLK